MDIAVDQARLSAAGVLASQVDKTGLSCGNGAVSEVRCDARSKQHVRSHLDADSRTPSRRDDGGDEVVQRCLSGRTPCGERRAGTAMRAERFKLSCSVTQAQSRLTPTALEASIETRAACKPLQVCRQRDKVANHKSPPQATEPNALTTGCGWECDQCGMSEA